MLDSYLYSVRKIFNHHAEVAISAAVVSEQRKRLPNGVNRGFGESLLSFPRKTRAVGGMGNDRPYCGKQPGVIVHLKLSSCRVSGHWSPQRARRMPRGNPDNNTIHPRKVECGVAI